MSAVEDPRRILFVCAGNTCRSPLATVLAGWILESQGWQATVVSAGVSAMDDEPASPAATIVAQEAGLDLRHHRARLLTRPMVLEAGLVLTMGERQREFIRVLAPEAMDRVHTLRAYATRGAATADVSDPYGGDLAAYRRTMLELRDLVEQSLQRWVEEATSPRS